jgi:hypothetical protein
MIIIKLKGGLGNQLFQYAFGRLLSLTKDAKVKYDFSENKNDLQRGYKLDKFNTKVEFCTELEKEEIKRPYGKISDLIDLINKKILRKYNIGCIPSLLNKKDGYLEGYFQSYKYLEPIRSELLEEITLVNPIDSKFSAIIKQMRNTNSVAVHVRRGDYVNDLKTKSQHYTFGLEYYEAAFRKIKSLVLNPTIFVFSDDIEWVKENLKSDLPMTYVSDPNMPDYENFFITTYCKHNIIANSSFSYWIAWLNQNSNKIVIAPKKWNNKYQDEYNDICPGNWIRI